MSFVVPKENNDVRRDKVWYLLTSRGEEGPFDPMALLHHPEYSPDIWCRHLRDSYWRPIRDIPELAFLFKDRRWAPGVPQPPEGESTDPQTSPHKPDATLPLAETPADELTLPLQRAPTPLLWLVALLLVALSFLFYQMIK